MRGGGKGVICMFMYVNQLASGIRGMVECLCAHGLQAWHGGRGTRAGVGGYTVRVYFVCDLGFCDIRV